MLREMPRRIPRHPTTALLGALLASAALAAGGADYFRGKILFEEGRYAEAGKSFAHAGRDGYDPPSVHYWMGRCYLRTGSPERALSHLLKAAEGGRADHEVHLGIALGLKATGRTTEALDALDAAEQEQAGVPQVHLVRGEILARSGRFEDAYESLRVAVTEFPEDVRDLAILFPLVHDRALKELATQAEADLREEAAARQAAAAAAAEAAARQPEEDPGYAGHGYTVVGKALKSGGPKIQRQRSWSDVQSFGGSGRGPGGKGGGTPYRIQGKTGGSVSTSSGS